MITQTTIDTLLRFESQDLPVVSIYLDTHPGESGQAAEIERQLKKVLKPVRELSQSDELSHDAKMSLRADVDKLSALSSRRLSSMPRGLAAFSCAQWDFFEVVSLPRRVISRSVVDSTPFVRPLLAILDEYHRFCTLVVDRKQAFLYEFYMGELLEHDAQISEGIRKKNFAGWYGLAEHRTRNHANEVAHRHYRAVASMVFEKFKSHQFDLLFIGGHDETNQEFIPFLHAYVRERLAGTFTIDTHSLTTAKVQEACRQLEAEYERRQENQLVDRLIEASVREQAGVLGLERTLAAANAAAIDLLLVQDEITVPGSICQKCRWLGLKAGECPVCQAATSEVPDVIDELVQDVIDEGGQVEHVYVETPLKEHLVGALTRFPVPAAI